MRQRKEKNMEERYEALGSFAIREPGSSLKGCWRSVFAETEGSTRKLFAEFGCGKGRFSRSMAKREPESLFLALDGNPSVLLIAAERYLAELKAEPSPEASAEVEGAGQVRPEASNLRYIRSYINDARDIFASGELSGIYLNFVDPWPKERHAKRRLTHRVFLKQYRAVLEAGGFIELRTDSDILFDFSLSEAESDEIRPLFSLELVSRDLHAAALSDSSYEGLAAVTTEYEEKFAGSGSKINFLRLRAV